MVIGGDAGGMTAVGRIRRLRPAVEIVVLEKGDWTSYSACGIPFVLGGEVTPLERLQVRTPQQFRERDRVDVRMRHEAVGIDIGRRTVEVTAHDQGRTYQLAFDQLLIATGGRPVRPPLPGIELDNVQGVHTLDNARRMLETIDGAGLRRVVVVGGGYIGLEMAEAFVNRSISTTLVEGSDQVMKTLDPDMARLVERALQARGVQVALGTRVTGFEPDGVVTTAGKLPADLVVLGIGIEPNSRLAADAGLTLGARDAIEVDRRQRASADGVYAAGDCAESTHLVSGRKVHVALGTVAVKHGRVAGINMGGGYATFPGVLGTAITKICRLEVARTGLNEQEAAEAGFETRSVSIDSTTKAGYYPGAEPMTVKLVVERGTCRILGAQIVGGQGAGKRIDAVAMAVLAGMDAEGLVQADLAYSPPFSGAWDPVQVAAREALK